MSIEAMKQALEALELANYKVADYCNGYTIEEVDDAITSLRQAIEQAEKPEPVAWVEKNGDLIWQNYEAAIGRNLYTTPPSAPVQEPEIRFKCTVIDEQHPNGVPLEQWGIAAQREWVGLTDEEVRECYGHVEGVTVSESVILMSVVRTTQAALKEKNT
jgi:hypothetical protein